ncbi:golgin subfamily A member 6-like protein 25 isoform X2 [Talpa occidentalis]|nr:golgin subfamily A member 6-like protein 25 isoform X2 [Talpa occidentalis]
MAPAPINKRKREEATCSICLQLMTEPVSFDCGHSFCHQCIEGSIEEQQEKSGEQPGTSVEQPERRRSRWRWASDYRLLRASMGEKYMECLGEYISAAHRKLESEKLCEEHGEQLRLFCEDTGQLICSGCAQSPQHSGHDHVLAKDLPLRSKEKLQEAKTKLRDLSWKLKPREQTTEWEDMKDSLATSSVPESVSSEPHTDCNNSELHCEERKKLKTDEGGAWASAPAAKRMRMEATCPICHELTTGPVSFSCGHSCCRRYAGGSLEEQPEESSWSLDCPSCPVDVEMYRDLLRTLGSIEAKLELECERPWEGHGDQPHQLSEDTGQFMCRGSAWSPQQSGHNHLVKDTCPGSEEKLQEVVTKPREQEEQCDSLKLSTGEQIRECEEKLQEAQTKLQELLAQSNSRNFKSSEQAREREEKLHLDKKKLRDLLNRWLRLKLKLREQREKLQEAVTKLRDLIDQWLSLKLKSREQTCKCEEKLQDFRTKCRDLLDQWLNVEFKLRKQEEKLLERVTKLRDLLDQWLSLELKLREWRDKKGTLKRNLSSSESRSSVPESVSSKPHTGSNDSELHCEERKRLKTNEGGATASNPTAKTSGEQPGTSVEQPGTSGEQSASRRCPFYHPSIQQSVLREAMQRLDEAISAAPRDLEGEKLCEIHAMRLSLFCEDTGQLICKFCARFRKHRGHKHVRAKNACLRSKEKLQEADTKLRVQAEQCDSLKLSTGEQTRELEEKLQEAQTKLGELSAQSKSRKFKSSEQEREQEGKLQKARTELQELFAHSKSQKLNSREQEEKLQEGVTKLRDLLDQWLSLKLKLREQREKLQEAVTKLRDLIDQWLSLKLKSREQTCECEEKLQDLRTKRRVLDQWLNLELKIREQEEKLLKTRTIVRERLDQWLNQKVKSREQTREQEDVKDTLTRSSVLESVSSEPHTDCNESELHSDESKNLKTNEGEQPGTSGEDQGMSDEDSCMSDEDSWMSDEDSWMSDEDSWMSDEDSWMSDEESWMSDEDLWMSEEESWKPG